MLKAGWHFPIPFVALIYALFWGGEEAEGAGLLAIAAALVLALLFPFRGKRIGIRDLYEMLRDTGTSVIDLFMIGAAAGIMIGALNYSGAGFTLSLVLIHLAGGSLIALLVARRHRQHHPGRGPAHRRLLHPAGDPGGAVA